MTKTATGIAALLLILTIRCAYPLQGENLTEDDWKIEIQELFDPNQEKFTKGGKPSTLAITSCKGRIAFVVAFGSANDRKMQMILDGEEVGSPYDAVLSSGPVFNSDGKRLAFAVANKNKQFVVLDGIAQTEFDGIYSPDMVFSPDGRRFAYKASRNNKALLVVDGIEGIECDGIFNNSIVFSPDSKRVAYRAKINGKSYVVVDGKRSSPFDAIPLNTFTFSPNGHRSAFVGQRGDKFHVVLDGKIGLGFDEILNGYLTFCPKSKRFAYAARLDDGYFVVVDGEQGPVYEAIGANTPCFNFDGTKVAYVAGMFEESKAVQRVIVNGEQGPPLLGLMPSSFFRPNGFRTLYVGMNFDGKWQVNDNGKPSGPKFAGVGGAPIFTKSGDSYAVVAFDQRHRRQLVCVNGKPGPWFDGILSGTVKFSPNGKRYAYVAEDNGRYFVVLDGRKGPKFDGIAESHPIFSPDSQHVAYIAGIENKQQLVLNGKRGLLHDGISDIGLLFSPNSNSIAYEANDSGKRAFIVDGQRTGPFDYFIKSSAVFLNDNEFSAIGARGQKLFKVTFTRIRD